MYTYSADDLDRLRLHIGGETRERGNELEWKRCPYCDGGDHGDKWTFSVNKETGQFICMRSSCGMKGAFVQLARDFNLELQDDVKEDYKTFDGSFVNRIDMWEATADSQKMLLKRGIPEGITSLYRVTTYGDKPGLLVFPFFDDKSILNTIKYRNTSFVKGETKGSKEWWEKNTKPILYGMWLCSYGGSLVVTEGQIDALSLAAAGIQNPVSVPGGAKNFKWVKYCREFVEKFSEIIVFGDCENGKITLVDEMCDSFPDMKVRKVRFQDYLHCKDANEILQALQDNGDYEPAFEALRMCVENAVDARQLPIKPLSSIEWHYSDDDQVIRTGFRSLDKEIRGLSYGQLVILTGWSGDGKSNFASQLTVNIAAQDIKCLIYSGELSNRLVKEQIAFIAAGAGRITDTLKDGLLKRRLRDEEQTRDALTRWMQDRLYIWEDVPITTDSTDKNDTARFIKLLEMAVKAFQIKFVLLDNLMTLLTVQDDKDAYLAQTNTIKALKTLAQQLDVVVMLVAHPRKSTNATRELTQDSISGAKDIVNLADMLFVYTRHSDQEKAKYPRRLNLLKNRRNGILLEGKAGVYLGYDSKSNRIGETKQDIERDYLKGYAPEVEPEIDF